MSVLTTVKTVEKKKIKSSVILYDLRSDFIIIIIIIAHENRIFLKMNNLTTLIR